MRRYIGETRVIKMFLLFPKTIYGEMRWLEVATWKEQLNSDFKWNAIGWINE